MSEEILLQRAFPVIEGIPEQLYAQTVERGFKDFLPPEKNLSYITTCEKVKRDYLKQFQQELYDGLAQFGYPYQQLKQRDPNNAKIDRWLGKFLYEKMNITPTVAATLGMWQFMNLFMFPSVVYWRWGDVKDRFLGIRRNYFGTQWWRHYFFTKKNETSREYMFMTEDEIVALYERAGTRGLPNQIDNNVLWYRNLCSKYQLDHQLSARLYREVIKRYNAELGYRNYFCLDQNDLFNIYEQVFKSCLGLKIEDIESDNTEEDNGNDELSKNTEEPRPTESQQPIKDISQNKVKGKKKTDSTKPKFVVVKKANNSDDNRVSIFSNNSMIISRNSTTRTIDIFFSEDPREITKFRIKQAGFKYVSSGKKWCAEDTEDVEKALKEIFGY